MDKELSRSFILFGGDYNPDQWDDETIDQDIAVFKNTRINTVTLPVFSWAKLEPSEGVYEFEWLDHILDKLDEAGLSYFLATPTSAQPAWLSKKYPEVLPVDIAGRKRTHGIMRALKGGESYYVMEQSPNQQNWQPYNKLKRPGEVRRLAYQGLAHGSDSSLYFQMRQSVAGQEKFHGAVISHSGRTDTRIIREFTELGKDKELC